MKVRTELVSGLVVAAAASVAYSVGVTTRIGTIESAAQAVYDSHAGDAKAVASAAKVLKALRKPANSRSLLDELKGVTAAATLTETKLPAEALFLSVFAGERAGYQGDLFRARDNLALAAQASRLPASKRRAFQKRLDRFDALPFGDAKAKLPTPETDAYSTLVAGAVQVTGFTQYDDGTPYRWAVTSLALAPNGQGVDLNGDRKADNAARTIQNTLTLLGVDADVDQILADSIGSTGETPLLEAWNVQSFQNDPVAFTGLFSGTEDSGVYMANAATLAQDGHPYARGFTPFSKGKYSVELTGSTLALGGLSLPEGAKIVVEGTASAGANDGMIGIAMPISAINQILVDAGITLPGLVNLSTFADIDTDGDGTKDAISISLGFSATAASVL